MRRFESFRTCNRREFLFVERYCLEDCCHDEVYLDRLNSMGICRYYSNRRCGFWPRLWKWIRG